MRFLGKLRGTGTLSCADDTIGPADYELDGYVIRPGAVVASGELHVASGVLEGAFGRSGLRLVTAEGRSLPLRFTGKPTDSNGQIAHIDISEGLPAEDEWRQRANHGISRQRGRRKGRRD